MDTKIVIHIYNGILFSYKKEHIRVDPNEVDELRAYYRVKSVRKRKRNIAYGLSTDEPICRAAMEMKR